MQGLLAKLAELGVRIDLKDGKLQVSAPPGVMNEELRRELAAHRDELLERLRTVPADFESEELPVIVPDIASRHLPFALNDVQHAYWIGRHSHLELGGVSTHLYLEFECEALDIDRLTLAFRKVIARHGMLRAVVDGDGRQRVLEDVPPYAIQHHDLRGMPADARERRLSEIRARMSQQVIPCDRWPLYEVQLASLDDGASRLCTSWDFLMVDAWSLMLIFREWHAFYRDQTYAPKPTDLTFRDYLHAEEALKHGSGYAASRKHWLDRIDSIPLAPGLPQSGRIEAGRKYEFTRRQVKLPATSWEAIKAYARRSGVTPSGALLAALSRTIGRWSKTPHYSLNLTLFNRRGLHPDVDMVVGDFTSLMVLEVSVDTGTSFLERALEIQKRFLEDFQHRQYSAVEVLREVRRRRNLQNTAILPVVFTSTLMLDGSRGESSAGLECFGPIGYGISQTPQVWLDHQIFEVNGDLIINWDAVEEAFLPGVLDDMFEAHCDLLRRLAESEANWHAPLGIELSSPQSLRREEVNATEGLHYSGCLHEAFIARALEAPERIAVRHDHGAITYGELFAISERLARDLIARGVVPNKLVGVVMSKGWEQIAAVLAIMIAGGAYLPIDPAWPCKRRELLLEQAEVAIALVKHGESVTDGWPAGVERVAVRAQADLPLPTRAPPVLQSERDLAYVIFTSGSTGMPKGVMIDHRGALNTVAHINRLFGIGREDAVLAVSELTFDLSVYDIFGPLTAGAAVVMPPSAGVRDPQMWLESIRRHKVTLWNSAPQLMGMLVDVAEQVVAQQIAAEQDAEQGSAQMSGLRLVLLSGDWVPVQLPGRIRKLASSAQVVSLGGATEGSIWSIYYPIAEVDPEWTSIPYGKPLPNQTMHVLDANLHPCPELVTGDIYIGGVGVALGYWKDPEKTARQFLSDDRGERLYRTGDLGRYRRDGTIEFLGREDTQVKLRGYRVELGEISSAIRSHPAIAESVVRLRKEDGRASLIAYVVPDAAVQDEELFGEIAAAAVGAERSESALRAGVQRSLAADRADLAAFADFWARLERLCFRGMLESLRRLELVDAGRDHAGRMRELAVQGAIRGRYVRLVGRWLALLQELGSVVVVDGCARSSETGVAAEPDLAVQAGAIRAAFAQYPALLDALAYVESCLSNDLGLLCGDIAPQALLFPDGAWRYAEALYQKNPAVRHHNAVIAAIVTELACGDGGKAPIRVLEVGAGTGGTSSSVLPALAPSPVEYVYTDISTYFFSGAAQKFAEYPFVRYEPFDIDKDPLTQGHPPHSFDLIVAANVSHNAHELGLTLGRLRNLLKPGGHLVMLEGTRNTPWQFATVAYLEMVDEYHDERMKQDAPVLDVDSWRSVLAAAGFGHVFALPSAENGCDPETLAALASAMPQHVIVAQGPLRVRAMHPETLSAYLAERLPEHMIPHEYVALERFPLSANGKVDVDALPMQGATRRAASRTATAPRTDTEHTLVAIWKDVLGNHAVGTEDNFFEVGGDSLLLTEVMRRINADRPGAVLVSDLFSHSTVAALADFIDGKDSRPTRAPPAVAGRDGIDADGGEIAVIGMAGRFPDAANIADFWANLAAGKCAVREFSEAELRESGVTAEELANPNYVRAGVVVEEVDRFDAAFFGITPREAQVMDPQQRMLLECAVQALDHAGYPDEKHAGRIGVFAGKNVSMYLLEHVLPDPRSLADLGFMALLNGNDKDYAAPLLSYKLDLTGPSLNVNTACSTSLVAVHMACRSLIEGECELALAGGAAVVDTRERAGHIYQEGHIVSRDGYCRAFADAADGCVFGSGVGLVVLKPLRRAIEDRDTIHAVIKGSAINNDGARKVGFTAPTAEGQAACISDALNRAGVSADSIQYIEAHGTGTHLGDPIEFAGLRRVFGGPRADGSRCGLGSVKSNVGHLDSAAGVTGLIKTVLALRHARIPASLHARVTNRNIDFADSPFQVVSEARDWHAPSGPRRAGVSAFGVGGTNAHVVLEEAPSTRGERAALDGPCLLVLSARSEAGLRRSASRLAQALAQGDAPELSDAAYTLQVGRKHYPHRLCVVAADTGEAIGRLVEAGQGGEAGDLHARLIDARRSAPVFFFAADGACSLEASAALYREYPGFRRGYDPCADAIAQLSGRDPRQCWNDGAAAAVASDDVWTGADRREALRFAHAHGLAGLWSALGIEPAAVFGAGTGEFAAAVYAGVFTVEEALSLVLARAQLQAAVDDGKDLAKEQAAGIYRECIAEVECRAPRLRLLSAHAGGWIDQAKAVDREHWVGYFEAVDRSADALRHLAELENSIPIDFGLKDTAASLREAAGVADVRAGTSAHASLRDARSDILQRIGDAWCRGAQIEWSQLHLTSAPGRVPLPGTDFERGRHWLPKRQSLRSGISAFAAEAPAGNPAAAAPAADPVLERIVEIWRDCLGVEQIGIDDNFFDLGGDSLLASRVNAKIKSEFDIELPSRRMHDFATVKHMCRFVSISKDRSKIESLTEEELAEFLAMMEA